MQKKMMKEKKHKSFKKIYFLYICIILIVVYGIIQIYAVFQSEVNGTVNLIKGVWQIKVNQTDISTGVNKEFTVDNIEVQNNEHVKPGNLAPGLSGIFHISIDPRNTDVSVRCDVSLNQENLTNKNITIKSIKETNQGKTLIKTDENTYIAIGINTENGIRANNLIKILLDSLSIELYSDDELLGKYKLEGLDKVLEENIGDTEWYNQKIKN